MRNLGSTLVSCRLSRLLFKDKQSSKLGRVVKCQILLDFYMENWHLLACFIRFMYKNSNFDVNNNFNRLSNKLFLKYSNSTQFVGIHACTRVLVIKW